jgi:hypothetical protein
MTNNSKKIPWGPSEKEAWFKQQIIQRSYQQEVVTKIHRLNEIHEIFEYGRLSFNDYPLFLLKSKNFDSKKHTVLITGGVHGYETSGVHGALAFMEREAQSYSKHFSFICAPCISPWAYETINRWNSMAIDPNRSFHPNSPAEESRLFLAAIDALNIKFYAHFDLHETTDTDNSVFRPAKALRDGVEEEEWSEIPDGFYLVGDTSRPQLEFQKAIIDSVRRVTHIAPPDEKGNIIGVALASEGVILYDMKKLFLCGGAFEVEYSTTTEVYPDSPKVTAENCVDAQVAAIRGGVKYLISFLT